MLTKELFPFNDNSAQISLNNYDMHFPFWTTTNFFFFFLQTQNMILVEFLLLFPHEYPSLFSNPKHDVSMCWEAHSPYLSQRAIYCFCICELIQLIFCLHFLFFLRVYVGDWAETESRYIRCDSLDHRRQEFN